MNLLYNPKSRAMKKGKKGYKNVERYGNHHVLIYRAVGWSHNLGGGLMKNKVLLPFLPKCWGVYCLFTPLPLGSDGPELMFLVKIKNGRTFSDKNWLFWTTG